MYDEHYKKLRCIMLAASTLIIILMLVLLFLMVSSPANKANNSYAASDVREIKDILNDIRKEQLAIRQRIATIKDGEDGLDGEPGAKGERGEDGKNIQTIIHQTTVETRTIIEPRFLQPQSGKDRQLQYNRETKTLETKGEGDDFWTPIFRACEITDTCPGDE